jgi:hypothetical protein
LPVIPIKLARLIKMCLAETYTRVRVSEDLSDMFSMRNLLKQGDALTSLFFNFSLDYAIGSVQVNLDGLKINGTYLFLVYVSDVNIYWEEGTRYKEKHRCFSGDY